MHWALNNDFLRKKAKLGSGLSRLGLRLNDFRIQRHSHTGILKVLRDHTEQNKGNGGKRNKMREKEIYLAGGCYWGVEKYISQIKGVISTEVGFANGNTEFPTYEQVKHENTGHAETVKVIYDSEKLPLYVLLKLFYRIIDPTLTDRQGGDIGHQYRTGI